MDSSCSSSSITAVELGVVWGVVSGNAVVVVVVVLVLVVVEVVVVVVVVVVVEVDVVV